MWGSKKKTAEQTGTGGLALTDYDLVRDSAVIFSSKPGPEGLLNCPVIRQTSSLSFFSIPLFLTPLQRDKYVMLHVTWHGCCPS